MYACWSILKYLRWSVLKYLRLSILKYFRDFLGLEIGVECLFMRLDEDFEGRFLGRVFGVRGFFLGWEFLAYIIIINNFYFFLKI